MGDCFHFLLIKHKGPRILSQGFSFFLFFVFFWSFWNCYAKIYQLLINFTYVWLVTGLLASLATCYRLLMAKCLTGVLLCELRSYYLVAAELNMCIFLLD